MYLQPLHIVSDLAADTAPVYFIEDRISPAMLYWDSKYLQMKQQYFHSEILHYIYETKHSLWQNTRLIRNMNVDKSDGKYSKYIKHN